MSIEAFTTKALNFLTLEQKTLVFMHKSIRNFIIIQMNKITNKIPLEKHSEKIYLHHM